ncbi:MAG: carbohydrate binding family 9 domain-containing protein [Phycisphaerae bacterium]|nr:carbohydrate binding family 9 domain-containing protein [Gemmatimonadaceae bacterium]
MVGPPLAHAQPSAVPEPDSLTRRHLIARRAIGAIRVDGRLSEISWQTAPVASDFVQVRQDYRPFTAYPSQVRVLYDDRFLYVGAFNRDSAGLSSLRMQDLRRDFESGESDVFGVTVGSLGDNRTSFQFQVSPLGSLGDVQAFDGGDVSNFNWDALWRARTTRTDSGWVAELAIPWTSLRYAPGLKSWDLNLVRNTRRALQWSAWSPYPRQFSSWRLSYAGVLDSISPPPPRANVRIRPYALTQAARDRTPGAFNGETGDVGGELIWAPTANSLFEATVNTDFAQADVDRQVVNLTRFNVFFPEQRGFFLENADLLSAGGLTGRYVVQPFFSRRIGLDDNGTPVPIAGGARYGYRTGRTSIGALVMHQRGNDNVRNATFGVARGSRFFGRSTRIATTVALREDGASARQSSATNVVTSLDAFTRIGEQIQLNATVSTSTQDGRTGVAATYFVARTTPFMYTGWLGAIVARDYNPRTGFVSRSDVVLTSPAVSINWQPSWRPKRVVWIKPGVTTYFYNAPSDFRLQEGIVSAYTEVLQTDGATWRPFVEHDFQRPERAVTLFEGVTIAPGTHDYWRYGIDAKSDQSARIAVNANLSAGGLFDGGLTRAIVGGRWSPNPYLALRATYELNRIQKIGVRDTSLVTHLAGPELRAFLNPRLQASAFYQYNTTNQRGTLNARFSWEFAPLSFFYVVYNDRQAIENGVLPTARSLIVKLSWLRQM